MKKIYEEIERAFQFENNKNFVFKIDKDFVAFRGHFPRQPLLPGIVQMEIALFCIKKLLNDETLNIGEAIKVKFIKPILPETKITVFIETKNEVFKAVIKDDKEIYSQMQLKVSSGKDDLPAEICEAQK